MLEEQANILYNFLYKISEPMMIELEKLFPEIQKTEFMNRWGMGLYIELIRSGLLNNDNHDQIIEKIRKIE